MLAADNWCVKVDERIYGPYSSIQLRKFAHEGRLAAWSLIAPAGSRAWREARDESTFAAFFGIDPRRGAAARSFGKRDDISPEDGAPPAQAKVNGNAQAKLARISTDRETAVEAGLSNFIIIFDVVNAAASRVETAVLSLGAGFRVTENVWAVKCELTAIGVRNAIAPYLLPRESILVIDSTRGRTSWQNFAPEVHAKLAAAWAPSK